MVADITERAAAAAAGVVAELPLLLCDKVSSDCDDMGAASKHRLRAPVVGSTVIDGSTEAAYGVVFASVVGDLFYQSIAPRGAGYAAVPVDAAVTNNGVGDAGWCAWADQAASLEHDAFQPRAGELRSGAGRRQSLAPLYMYCVGGDLALAQLQRDALKRLAELQANPQAGRTKPDSAAARWIRDALSTGPESLEELLRRCTISSGPTLDHLLAALVPNSEICCHRGGATQRPTNAAASLMFSLDGQRPAPALPHGVVTERRAKLVEKLDKTWRAGAAALHSSGEQLLLNPAAGSPRQATPGSKQSSVNSKKRSAADRPSPAHRWNGTSPPSAGAQRKRPRKTARQFPNAGGKTKAGSRRKSHGSRQKGF